MKIVFQTPPIRGVERTTPDGRRHNGTAVFTAALYAPTEAMPSHAIRVTVAEWRRTSLHPDGSLRFTPPRDMVGATPIVPVVVPAAVIDALPADHFLAIRWRLEIGGLP